MALLLLASSTPMLAQQPNSSSQASQNNVARAYASCRGIVVSADDAQPIIGATVKVKGSSNEAVTDADGNFVIGSVPKNATLVISYLGMKSIWNTFSMAQLLLWGIIGLIIIAANLTFAHWLGIKMTK